MRHLLGTEIVGGAARLGVSDGTMNHLNSAICMQMATKTPIKRTPLQFDGIKRVEYEVDGVVITEWDG